MSRFTLIEQNEGYLEFFMAAGQRQTTNSEQVPQELTPQSVKSAIRIRGTIVYNDERKELRSIQTDPQAINDVLVSHFMDKKGRVGAEVVSYILRIGSVCLVVPLRVCISSQLSCLASCGLSWLGY